MVENYSMEWFMLAFMNAGFAQLKYHASGHKGWGGLAWFWYSLFLGPIATFIIIVYKRPSDTSWKN